MTSQQLCRCSKNKELQALLVNQINLQGIELCTANCADFFDKMIGDHVSV